MLSVRTPSIVSPIKITGIWNCSARLKALIAWVKQSATDRRQHDPLHLAVPAERREEEVALLVAGRHAGRGAGPLRIDHHDRISAIKARPSSSTIRLTPGPEVAVIDFLPAYEAPITMPSAAISSSAWTTEPPTFGSSAARNSMMSVAGVIG